MLETRVPAKSVDQVVASRCSEIKGCSECQSSNQVIKQHLWINGDVGSMKTGGNGSNQHSQVSYRLIDTEMIGNRRLDGVGFYAARVESQFFAGNLEPSNDLTGSTVKPSPEYLLCSTLSGILVVR